ncbi:MAG: hypothetical protein JJ935_05540 [Muricauda sp.]|nr:hypothetical protein [Allomuricauda sp.]MBO6588563.1 hypothetical protein [Allomuricauda sp.]MBO6644101.1 hypothetical protein [Allomuricauda sp.]MBO6746985.1 hypothetical protein [Allomuricauda sp.]
MMKTFNMIGRLINAPSFENLWVISKNPAINCAIPINFQYNPDWYMVSKKCQALPIGSSAPLSEVKRSPFILIRLAKTNAPPSKYLI